MKTFDIFSTFSGLKPNKSKWEIGKVNNKITKVNNKIGKVNNKSKWEKVNGK